MSPRILLCFFGLAHSFALLSKNLQSIVNEELMPSDLVKMKAVDPNWRGEGIFERITKDAGLFAHKETNEIILETKEKLWTETEIIEELGYLADEFKNLIETKNWNRLFARYFGPGQFEKYWRETLAEVVDLNEIYSDDGTVLMKAVMSDGPNVVKILLKRGADVSTKDSDGWTALHFAANWKNNIEAIKLLLEFKADINATDNSEETPLMKAAMHHSADAVKLLLEREARLDLKNNDEKIALDIAKLNSYRSFPGSMKYGKTVKLLESHQTQVVLENKKYGCDKFVII